MKLQKFVFRIIVILLTVFVAYISGIKAAGYWNNHKKDTNHKKAIKSILSQMDNIAIGDTIPDYSFDDLFFQSLSVIPSVPVHSGTISFYG